MASAGPHPAANIEQPVAAAIQADWQALGTEDDHLRLCVLIASTVREAGSDTEPIAACLARGTPWLERLGALREVLRAPAANGRSIADLDALAVSERPQEEWDDRRFLRERTALLEVLIEAGAQAGWTFLRPAPQEQVTEMLTAAGVWVAPSSVHQQLPPGISRELHPLAEHLLGDGVDTDELWEIHEAAQGADFAFSIDHYLTRRADQKLTAKARDAALRLSMLRPPQHLNGSVGVLPVEGSNVHRVSRLGIDELLQRGFLDRHGDYIGMPRAIRDYYRPIAETTGDIDARGAHQWIADHLSDLSDGGISGQLERHHHRIGAHDVEGAFDSGAHYVADIRSLGVWLSRMGRINEANYLHAADVFERLCAVDQTDAYSWEYWAYNRARGESPWVRTADPLRQRLADAYERAWRLDLERRAAEYGRGPAATNPLYHGRWLGFRAECEEDIVAEMKEGVATYAEINERAVAWFGKPVVQGARRCWSVEARQRLLDAMTVAFGRERMESWLQAAGDPDTATDRE